MGRLLRILRGRARIRWALIAICVATTLGVPVPAAGQADEDLIVEETGLGFEIVEHSACTPLDENGQARSWQSELGLLCIIRTGPLGESHVKLMVEGSEDPAGDVFDVAPLNPAVGIVYRSPPPIYVVTFGAGPYLYNVFLQRTDVPATFDERELLVALAEWHVALIASKGLETGDDTSATSSATADQEARVQPGSSAQELLGLLVVPEMYVPASPAIPDAHLVADISSEIGDVAQAFSDGTNSVLQLYVTPDELVVGVFVAEYKFPLFAAAVLGSTQGEPLSHEAGTLFGGRPIAASHADEFTLAFRRNRIVFLVSAVDSAPVSDELVQLRVEELAVALFDSSPSGDTSAFFFPTATEAALQTAFLVGLLGLGVVGSRMVITARPQRLSVGQGDQSQIVDMTNPASILRRRGKLLFLIQLVALAGFIVSLTVLEGAVRIAAGLVAVLLAIGATLYARRLDTASGGKRPTTQPEVVGLVVGILAMATLAVGIALAVRGAQVTLFRPSLSHLELADQMGVDPGLLGFLILGVGVLLLAVGATLYRVARRRGRANAERLRSKDHRPAILYLRSFEDDLLPIRTTFSSRRPVLEWFSVRGGEPFEEAIAWQISAHGPVIAVGRPDRPLASLGAAREHIYGEEWRDRVDQLMSDARAIVLVIGETSGLEWEVRRVVERGFLDKTMFISPPVESLELGERWDRVIEVFDEAGIQLWVGSEGTESVVTSIAEGGSVWIYTADMRDEAAYRVCVDAAVMSRNPADED